MSIQLTKLIADFDTQLAAPVAIGDTTATLVSVTDDDGNTIPNGTYGFTIDAGNSSKEYIICTVTSTAITAVYSASRQGVATSGFARSHRRGAKVTITDWSAIKGIQNVLEVGYASATTPTTDYMLATKKYVDDASFAGATNASTTTPGVVELPTQAEVDAKTASGGLGPLAVTPDTLRATKYNDAVASATGTDAYAITVVPAITAYVLGQEFSFIADVANTGACTLNVSGLGAKTIKKDVSTDTVTGDILAGQTVKVMYDGTNMQMLSITSGLSKNTDVQIFTTEPTSFGDSTTQFDITNPSGTTFRYTYDGTGTDPGITTSTFPTGAFVQIKSYNSISSVNEGLFIITGSGTNYFEVTNTIGGAENDKTLGNGGLLTVLNNVTWTKPDNAKSVEVIAIGGGAGGGYGTIKGNNGDQHYGATGGGGGAIARAIFRASDLSSTVKINVGFGGTGGTTSPETFGKFGGTSAFGSYLLAYGGGGGYGSSTSQQTGGAGGGTGGTGSPGGTSGATVGGLPASTAGANGIAGQGGGGTTGAGAQAEYGGAGGAGGVQNTTGPKGGNSIFGGGAGGSGGGINGATPGIPYAGGNGGVSGAYKEATGAAAGGAATGVAGGAGTSRSGYGCGDGGAGGGAYNTGTAGAGGAGGSPGGGGGGGGSNAVSTTGGAGGKGGRGEVRVYTYF